MRKNQSKYKNKEYVNSIINTALEYNNIIFIECINNYAYFKCTEHGKFKKRLDHINESKYNPCPKCLKNVYAKMVGNILCNKHTIDEYVDTKIFKPLEEYKGVKVKIEFLCTIHNKKFIATPARCFGCDICKQEHHYKWKKDWKHIDQNEIIRRCQLVHPEYDYSMVNYINATTPIDIICPKHSVFKMSYANLTNKSRPQKCPFCSKMYIRKISKMTQEVLSELDKYNIDYITEKTFSDLKDKKVLPIDIYIPKYNIAIEYQGAQHFRFVKSFCKDLNGFEYIKYHDKLKYEYFKNSDIKLYYYTSIYNENLIPNNYFDKVYTNIDELIEIITK